MGLYATFGRTGIENVNLTPFCEKVEATLAGAVSNGQALVTLVELPDRFPLPAWDLSQWLVPGAHAKLWQDEGGLVAFRFFGGILLDATEIAGDADRPQARRYQALAQSYDGAALDGAGVGEGLAGAPAYTIPAGPFRSQVLYAVSQHNAAAALVMDTSGVQALTGAYSYPALPVRESTLRQVLRALCARAVAVNHLLVPRFEVSLRRGASSDFGPPCLLVYDAAVPGAVAAEFADVAVPGRQRSTIGAVQVTRTIRPPYATRALVTNVGGAHAEATAAGPTVPNLLNGAGTWDTVAVNVGNPASELAAEAGRLASKDARVRQEVRWQSYGWALPGDWVRLYHRLLHGYALGPRLILTDVQISWTQKTQDTILDGVNVGNPVLLQYTGTDRAPELGDDPQNGAALDQVLANAPATATRNFLQSAVAGQKALSTADDAGLLIKSWVVRGVHHPIGVRMTFASSATKAFVAEDDYTAMGSSAAEQSGAGGETLSYAQVRGGVSTPVTDPFDGLKGDRIEVTAAGVGATPFAVIVREADPAVAP